MASTGTSWETVKSTKKSKGPSHGAGQGKKKVTPDTMPRIEPGQPLKESPTIYDALIEKERKAQARALAEQQSSRGDSHTSNNNASASKKQSQPKKKVGGAGDKKKAVRSLEEAVAQIELNELETVLTKDQAMFPDNPSVWLLDLASLLNLRLEDVAETDPLFEDKSQDYPMELFPNKVRALLLNTIHHCSTETLTKFTEHIMQTMINDIGKGMSVHGYRMFIQLLAHHKPDIVLKKLPKYLELVQNNKNRPLRCLAIMWGVGQAGLRDLAKGFQVWLELMLPVLNCRALSAYGVSYLDRLLKIHEQEMSANGVLGFKNFFLILDNIFSQKSPLPSQQQKKLLALYPRIKEISFGRHPESALRHFFPSFLARLTPHCSPQLKAEILRSLVECLEKDSCCYGVWRQMYIKHMLHSSALLEHLVTEWSTVHKKLDKRQLKETIGAFKITNEEIAANKKTAAYDGYSRCVEAITVLQEKMSGSKIPWRFLFFILFSLAAGLLTYDVYTSKGFEKSRTNKFLVDKGVILFLQNSWARIRVYGGKAAVWLEVNVPYYYARTCELVGPYLQLFWQKLYALGVYIAEVTAPQRAWVQKKIPEGIDYIQAKWPGLYAGICDYARLTWDFLVYYSLVAWRFIVHYSLITGTWLQENVFVGSFSIENLQKLAVQALTTLQEYITAFIQWFASLLASAMSDPSPSSTQTPTPVKAGGK